MPKRVPGTEGDARNPQKERGCEAGLDGAGFGELKHCSADGRTDMDGEEVRREKGYMGYLTFGERIYGERIFGIWICCG